MKHSTNQRDPRGVSPEDMAALRAIGTDISNSDNSDIDQQQNNMNEDNDPDREPAVRTGTGGSSKAYISEQNLRALFDPLVNMQRETVVALRGLQQQVVRMQNVERETGGRLIKDWFILAIILIFQIILQWIFR